MGYIGNEPTTGHFPVQTNLVGAPSGSYTLDRAPASAGAIEVSVQGVLQPTTAYSVSGTTLTMAGVTTGIPIFIRYLGETLTLPTIADGTVVESKIGAGAVTGSKIQMGSDQAGDIITYNGTDYIRLAKGTAAQVLKMNAGATAVEWGTDTGGIAVPGSSVVGDTLYHNGTIYTRLAKGTAAQVLTMNAGATAPEWTTPAGGGAWEVLDSHDYSTTNATTVTWTNFTPTTHLNYVFILSGVNAASAWNSSFRVGNASSISTTGNYYLHRPASSSSSGSYAGEGAAGATNFALEAFNVRADKSGMNTVIYINFTKYATNQYYLSFHGTQGYVQTNYTWVTGFFGGYFDERDLWTRWQYSTSATITEGIGTMYKLTTT